MGATIHWIDTTTLKMVSKILCCRHFVSPHTNTRIASLLQSIIEEFGIGKKVIGCVTDNGSNYVKAFKKYGMSIDEFNQTNSNDDDEVDPIEFVSIEDNVLPSHFRCAAHTLSRVGTKDANDAKKDRLYQMRFDQAFLRLNAICKKYNRPKSCELIKSILKSSLVLPCKTRRNSLYDSIKRILEIDLKSLNKAAAALSLDEFSEVDMEFFREYVMVMEPIATSIDQLQADTYYSYLLPVLTNIKYSLESLADGENLQHCVPLLKSITAGFNRRFGHFFDLYDDRSRAAVISSSVHPYFKMRWVHKVYDTDEYFSKIQEILYREALVIANADFRPVENSQRENTEGKCHLLSERYLFVLIFCKSLNQFTELMFLIDFR